MSRNHLLLTIFISHFY